MIRKASGGIEWVIKSPQRKYITGLVLNVTLKALKKILWSDAFVAIEG